MRRMISVWFPEAVVTPTSRVHLPPAHLHHNYSLVEQQTTSSNRSSLSCTLKSTQQLPNEGLRPAQWGGCGAEQSVLYSLPGMHSAFPPRRTGSEEWTGMEKVLVHSPACPGTRVRCASTCTVELWSPLGLPA